MCDAVSEACLIAQGRTTQSSENGDRNVLQLREQGRSHAHATEAQAPISIAFSPSGGLLASLDQGGPTVSMHSVGSGGALTSLGSPVSTGAGTTPIQVVFSPSGNLLATADWSDQVSVFSVGAGGSLTPVAGSPFTTNGDTFSVAFSPSGDLLATADNIPTGDGGFAGVVSVFAVGSGGALTQVPGSPFTTGDNPVSVAFSPDGTLLATANASGTVSVFSAGSDGSLDPAPGSPVSVGANLNPLEVVFSPSGGLVAVPLGENDQGVAMFAVTEPATGYVDSTAPPKLEGKAAPGHRLIATSGAWKTSSRLKFAFHWALCAAATDQGGTPLAGGTGRLSPRLTSSAAGSYITVVVSATNATSQSAQAYASEQVDSASTSRARR